MGRVERWIFEVWGESKSWDQYCSKFHAMQRQSDEFVSKFSRRFSIFYYKIPKEIQPLEGAAKPCYVATFHSDLALCLLERKSVSLQHMFSDA